MGTYNWIVPLGDGMTLEQALRAAKNKHMKSGLKSEMRRHEYRERPGVRRNRKHAEALKRLRKKQAKQLEREQREG
jgi:small subunit ribosomal protein S21